MELHDFSVAPAFRPAGASCSFATGFAMGFAIGCGVGVAQGVAQGVAAKFNKTSIWSSDGAWQSRTVSVNTHVNYPD
jgi:hypothetical protein